MIIINKKQKNKKVTTWQLIFYFIFFFWIWIPCYPSISFSSSKDSSCYCWTSWDGIYEWYLHYFFLLESIKLSSLIDEVTSQSNNDRYYYSFSSLCQVSSNRVTEKQLEGMYTYRSTNTFPNPIAEQNGTKQIKDNRNTKQRNSFRIEKERRTHFKWNEMKWNSINSHFRKENRKNIIIIYTTTEVLILKKKKLK